MNVVQQRTIKNPIHCRGIGLHSGVKTSMTLHPASPNSGVVFRRTDAGGAGAEIAAQWRNVVESSLCTTLSNGEGITIGTVEHLMAALAGAQDAPDRLVIDSTCIKVHRCAGGAKGGPLPRLLVARRAGATPSSTPSPMAKDGRVSSS